MLMLEALHRRISYLEGATIRPLTEVARTRQIASNALLNQAKRQSIPAFRERGVWKIAGDRDW